MGGGGARLDRSDDVRAVDDDRDPGTRVPAIGLLLGGCAVLAVALVAAAAWLTTGLLDGPAGPAPSMQPTLGEARTSPPAVTASRRPGDAPGTSVRVDLAVHVQPATLPAPFGSPVGGSLVVTGMTGPGVRLDPQEHRNVPAGGADVVLRTSVDCAGLPARPDPRRYGLVLTAAAGASAGTHTVPLGHLAVDWARRAVAACR